MMLKLLNQWLIILLSAILVTGCTTMSPEQKGALEGGAIGTVVGGLVGGVVGATTGNNKGKSAAVGAIAGGMLGALIGQRMNQQKEQLEQVTGVETVQYDEQKQQIDATLRILFDWDKDLIKPAEAIKLDQLAAVFQQYPENMVVLEGHTDSDGTDLYNQQLSERRAMAIARYLQAKNLNIASLNAVGYGELRPIASNDTSEGKALNRRVELKISVDPNRVPQQTQSQPVAVPAVTR